MQIDNAHYDGRTELPKDDSYLEAAFPGYLQISHDNMRCLEVLNNP